MKDQGALIDELDWDYLIILDALRYDYSGELLKHFDGELTKVKSRGSSTLEWVAKTFDRWYNLTYISATSCINSAGFPLSMYVTHRNYSWSSWKATDHFSCIVDVWDSEWDGELWTVPPENVNEECLKHRDDKMIVHYIQPHLPFLSRSPMRERKHRGPMAGGEASERGALTRLRGWTGPKVERLIRGENIWRIRRMLGLEPVRGEEKIWREKGREGLRHHYQKNLIEVAEAASSLCKQLSGRIVITSDHGEGFEKISAHPPETHLPELTEVPWLEVET